MPASFRRENGIQLSQPPASPKHVEILSPMDEVPFPSEWYDLNGPDHFWFRWRFAVVRRLLAGLKLDLKAPARALDIGCGVGTSRDQIEGFTGWTVDGVDLNLKALEQARPGRGRLFFYDILKPRPEFVATYDCIFLFDVLEHISPTREFVESVLRPLRPGGLLFVNVPALESLRSVYDTAAGHFRRYTPQSLAREFEGHPARIEDVRYWGFSLVPLLLIRKVMLSRQKDPGKIIRAGFQPPSQWLNSGFSLLGKLETTLLRRPPLGTSVMMALRKVN
jgi:SAM-dependent methyltransferase